MKEVPWARGFYGLDGNRLNSMWSNGNALNPKKIGEPEGREALMYKIYIQCILPFTSATDLTIYRFQRAVGPRLKGAWR